MEKNTKISSIFRVKYTITYKYRILKLAFYIYICTQIENLVNFDYNPIIIIIVLYK